MILSAPLHIPGIKKQQGIVLVVALLILVVMTVLGVSMLSSSTLEERMASNLQSQNVIFQAAESCVRTALLPANEPARSNAAVALDINPNANPAPINCVFDNNTINAQVNFGLPASVGQLSKFSVTKFGMYPLSLNGASTLASGASSTVQAVIKQPAPKL